MSHPRSISLIACLLLALSWDALAEAPERAYISIIIDDIGHSRVRGERAINLPASLNYAIIPESAHAKHLANYANDAGKEVMLHLPMANTRQHPMEKLALTSNLDREAFINVFERAVSEVPHIKGVNNHMGSHLTGQPQAMHWLMQAIKSHKLFFVDSRTTHRTVAREMAQYRSVLNARRDVFLDNVRTEAAIANQVKKLKVMAKQRKTAIAIGHPYPETLDYLEKAIPLLAEENIQIVSVSEIIGLRIASAQLASSRP